jgi:hypothetical protein
MRQSKANEILENTISDIEKNGLEAEKVAAVLRDVRPMALTEKDPLLTRAIRLTYEHLEENNDFELECLEESDSPSENLVYFLQLWIQSENKYNRDEIREFADALTEMA